ncbi:hypothetical protein [Kribbella yunnanensis]|uniref:hypothetical protein n=1 Tax=Kribbella yunnanensis TaxID=190194 RepID=UPI0031D74AA7
MVYEAIRVVLGGHADINGVTCLAKGADQIFAQAVLDSGGQLTVVLPSLNYREAKVKPANLARFDDLLSRADVVYMPFDEAGRTAYMAASEELVSRSELLVAVWDGKPAGGYGGTADVVEHARTLGLPVHIVWPEGAEREAG